jgi:hypothetical protein
MEDSLCGPQNTSDEGNRATISKTRPHSYSFPKTMKGGRDANTKRMIISLTSGLDHFAVMNSAHTRTHTHIIMTIRVIFMRSMCHLHESDIFITTLGTPPLPICPHNKRPRGS